MACFRSYVAAVFASTCLAAAWGAQPASAAVTAVSSGEKPVGSFVPKTEPALKLRGSRGETLNFQLKVSGLRGCANAALGGLSGKASLHLYSMEKIPIEHASFTNAPLGPAFDPLIPLEGNRVCPAAGADATWIWGELEIPETASPGNYKGKLALGSAGNLPVSLKIWHMTIPSRPALPAYSELTSWFLLLGHYGQYHDGQAQLTEAYAREMMKHRLMPLKSWVAVPEVVKNGDFPKLDLVNKPSREQSFAAVTLAHRPPWAYFDFPTVPNDKVDDPSTPEYFRAVQGSLKEVKNPSRAMIYLWDEPAPEAIGQLKKLATIAHKDAPGAKLLVTTVAQPELEGLVDIYVPVMDQFATGDYPPPEAYAKLQKKGKEVWWYVSCMSHGCDALADSGTPDMVIERPASYIRSIAWLAAKYNIDGFLYYSVDNGYQQYPKRDPWKSLWDFSGNGDGTLFYPGRVGEHGFTKDTPVPSIRLKLWRESSFDAEYLKWMREAKKKPAWWNSAFSSLVTNPRKWDRDYGKYQTLRDRIGDYLDGGSSR